MEELCLVNVAAWLGRWAVYLAEAVAGNITVFGFWLMADCYLLVASARPAFGKEKLH
jgi:hypothetical protein